MKAKASAQTRNGVVDEEGMSREDTGLRGSSAFHDLNNCNDGSEKLPRLLAFIFSVKYNREQGAIGLLTGGKTFMFEKQ